MAKGSRSSVRKTNNTKLKARVFGPVENARTERLSAKLMELAAQPKPPKVEMDVEESVDAKSAEPETKETSHADDAAMDLDGKSSQPRTSSIKAEKRRKEEKIAKIAKKRHRKAVNTIAFPKSRVAKSKKGGKR